MISLVALNAVQSKIQVSIYKIPLDRADHNSPAIKCRIFSKWSLIYVSWSLHFFINWTSWTPSFFSLNNVHFPLKLLQSKQKQSTTHSHLYVFFAAILFFNVFKFFRIPISFKIRSLPSHLLQTPISAHFRASLYFIITQPFKRVFLLQFFFQCVSAFLNT